MERGISWEDRIKGAYASCGRRNRKWRPFSWPTPGSWSPLTIGELASAAGVKVSPSDPMCPWAGLPGIPGLQGGPAGWEAGGECL